jgi:Pleckstrin homology domain/Sporulation protein family 7
MTTVKVQPVGTRASNHASNALDADTYTAGRLKHATPEHLHLTTRRFFIGPIPEGWLKDNRKSWYKRRLELSNYSGRSASFSAAPNQGPHHRTLTGLEGPSSSAAMGFSFPQPEDVNEDRSGDTTEIEDNEDEDPDIEARVIEPISTNVPQVLGIADQEGADQPKLLRAPTNDGLKPPEDSGGASLNQKLSRPKSPTGETFVSAKTTQDSPSRSQTPKKAVDGANLDGSTSDPRSRGEGRTSGSNGDDTYHTPAVDGSPSTGDANSMTRLLPPGTPALGSPAIAVNQVKDDSRSMRYQEPLVAASDSQLHLNRTTTGVRFKVSEAVEDRQQRIGRRVDSARDKFRGKTLWRSTLQEGAIVKMEKMLVRVDFTQMQLENTYDENDSLKTETRSLEKWREFMVVARKSNSLENEDFRLQMYKTRVVPQIDNDRTKKKPTREVRLDRKTTHVNLYSSLDKTVVIWHPYKKGTRIIIMRPRSFADSVEWYTFLRDALGWKRPSTLQVNVPDLDVNLRLDRPFEELQTAAAGRGSEADDELTQIARAQAAEQAVAGRIIDQCLELLKADKEWASVLKTWAETSKMGLAWKRYDRLEWVYGVQEQKMFGTMAMQNAYDLELRPKQHYPTCTFGKKGVHHDEPAPIEGFLIRLTSQKGIHKRMGKTFFKRLYFSTHNQFMIFNRPAQATPPHPPHLATISGRNIPTSHDIVEKTPMTFDIEPFKLKDRNVSWLDSGDQDTVGRHDIEALEEARRNLSNLESSDGYINLCHIVRVRKMHWGEAPADDHMDSGADDDVDFHQAVPNTPRDDGVTDSLDESRTFELVLKNDLVIRLQAYDETTCKEWMRRLKKLVKYWKLRTTADLDLFKAVRRANLTALNIDEEMEAVIGQFARKWEVERSEASPTLYHMCGISSCRSITMSGLLYRKRRRRATFHRCGVILTGGKLLIFQHALRKMTGEVVKHIHAEKQHVMDLSNCYVYSGLITEDDLLYTNQTFDSNHPGVHALPRVYTEDAWTSRDEDSMTTFVVWHATQKSWFRQVRKMRGGDQEGEAKGKVLRRVSKLGVPGRGAVFKCRSRAERDHWVTNLGMEIERCVQQESRERGEEVRLEVE